MNAKDLKAEREKLTSCFKAIGSLIRPRDRARVVSGVTTSQAGGCCAEANLHLGSINRGVFKFIIEKTPETDRLTFDEKTLLYEMRQAFGRRISVSAWRALMQPDERPTESWLSLMRLLNMGSE